MEETPETPEAPPETPAEISATSASPRVIGRPFVAGGPSANPGGRPKDPIARLVREATCDGAEIVSFLLAVMRDDLDGRIADKGGMVDRLEVDASIVEAEVQKAKDDGDVFKIATLEGKARELRSRAKGLRAKLSRKRKIAVAVKTRHAAAETLLERAYGKALETIDLGLGNRDGSPLGSPAPTGPLAALTTGDLAAIGEVLDRAAKRGATVDAVEGGDP